METHLEREEKITNYWKEHKIFEKSMEQRKKENSYVFYDGPPFATGLPHHGHILGSIVKDLIPRYQTMKGKRVERRWGWDCHGLPIENIAEKDLKIKGKKQIEEMGIEKFNNYCKEKVFGYVDEWEKRIDKIGRWVEFKNSYKTMDNTYIESVWWAFKELYDKGLIYEGKKILMYCPRCETPLSNFEISMDNSYKDVKETTATAKFKIKNEDAYLLAWTTTPWTLVGNVAIAINPKLIYVKIEKNGEKLILAKSLVEKNIEQPYNILEEIEGKKLVGKEYTPLYEIQTDKKAWYIIDGGDEVTDEDGTGLVHMAIYGEFDYEMIKKHDLPIIQHINEQGKLCEGPEDWKGIWFKEIDKKVIEDLENRLLLHSKQDYLHSYPFCYRCETPLIYNAIPAWFINIQKIKPLLKKTAKEINWYPAFTKEMFENIIETAPDWNISRNRYWATAIPIWKSENGKLKIIGSVKELQQYATEKIDDNIDLHKHTIDKIKLKIDNEIYERIPEVMDCWFESASMPYAAEHYPFENKDWFENNFPSEFVSEYIAQVRAWFYAMHVLSTAIFGKNPFKNVVVSGVILAEDGTKMSKSKNNFTEPMKIVDSFGADALRYYLMTSPVMQAQSVNFKDEVVKEISKKLLNILINVNNFYKTLIEKEDTEIKNPQSENILDKWIISELNELNKTITNAYNKYDIVEGTRAIIPFVDELSTWYLRRSRNRLKSTNQKEKNEAIHTLEYVLFELSKLISPATPFIAEEIYQTIKEKNNNKLKESVHLEDWTQFEEEKINMEMKEKMQETREIVSIALMEREKEKMPIKQPLQKATIKAKIKLEDEYLELIKDEINVKEIIQEKSEEVKIELDTTMTEELKQERIVREIIRNVNGMRKKLKLTIKDKIIIYLEGDVEKIITQYSEEIKQQTQTNEIILNQKNKEYKTIEVLETKIGIEIEKTN